MERHAVCPVRIRNARCSRGETKQMSINEIHGKMNIPGTPCKFCDRVLRSRVRHSEYGRSLPVTMPALDLFNGEKIRFKNALNHAVDENERKKVTRECVSDSFVVLFANEGCRLTRLPFSTVRRMRLNVIH